MSEIILEIRGLKKAFGGAWAVREYKLNLPRNKIYGLIGPNGAGKTTIFNLITGLIKPDGGKIIFEGKDITNLKPHQIAKLGISRTFQTLRLFKNLTVEDNVKIARHMHVGYGLHHALLNLPKFLKEERELDELSKELLELFGLYEYKHRPVGSLPYGHQRKLEVVRALAMEPKLLLLDEPSAGMTHKEAEELSELIREIQKEHSLTMIIVEHRMPFVMNLAETIQVLYHGVLIAEGTPKEVRSHPEVIKAYFGEKSFA